MSGCACQSSGSTVDSHLLGYISSAAQAVLLEVSFPHDHTQSRYINLPVDVNHAICVLPVVVLDSL